MKKLNYDYVKKYIEDVEGYILISEDYKNCKEKLSILHNKCGNMYMVNFDNFKNGKRCPMCSRALINKDRKLNKNTFQEKLNFKFNNEYIVLGNYINNRTKIKVQHNCGYIYDARPDNLLQGYGCPKCNGGIKSNIDIFKKQVFELYNDEYTVLGDYINNHTNILIRHNSDKCNNNEFYVKPSNFISNKTICPICAKSSKSKGERKIEKWLIENNFSYEREYKFDDCKDKNFLRFDFCLFINNEKYLIEYDGRQHFLSSDKKQQILKEIQKRDKIKNDYCKNNNLKLLRIKYTDYKNIENILSETFNDYPKTNNIRE